MSEPTQEAIQKHQRRVLRAAADHLDEEYEIRDLFTNELQNAIDANERGDTDGAMDIAEQLAISARSAAWALLDFAKKLGPVSEEPGDDEEEGSDV